MVECMDRATSLTDAELLPPPATPSDHGADTTRPTFAEMYRDGFSFVWRNLRRLGVAEESVRDATQDVFLVVHRRIDSFDGTSTVKTWLFAIALRVAQDYRRAARRKALHAVPSSLESERDPLDRVVARQAGPFEQAEAAQASRLLLQLLDELDEDRRSVFVLTELEQMSAPEIAEALGLNLNTVYGRLRSARQEFNQALARFRARRANARPAALRRLP
jgi:RNA polymerase sigma-70 factor, ECF subfamily